MRRREMTPGHPAMNAVTPRNVAALVGTAKVLIVDDDHYMRKVIRSLLLAIGIKNIFDAPNGTKGLESICTIGPDIVILDWELPDMTGAEFMRAVRSPGKFMFPAVPVVMLTGHVDRERVVEAISLGVHEFLCKPVSAKTLLERIVSIRAKPRRMV
ncbi:MAG: response regulator, partial [Pseudorhodoplanes sp.]